MGNRIGIIFHENYKYFSPLIYDHFGGEYMIELVRAYLKEDRNGYIYNCGCAAVVYLAYIKAGRYVRIENLSDSQLERLKLDHKYSNEFDASCLLVNVEKSNFGNIDIC
jgi:hypothetical protein